MKKQKHTGLNAPFFDKEEEETVMEFERGEYVRIGTREESLEFWQAAVRNLHRYASGTLKEDA